MTHTEDLMTHPPAMAEMADGLPDLETARVALDELENEGHGTVPPVLAHLAAETEQ